MNKTKFVITGFAVFASVLMVMTTCMARPVQEKTIMNAVEIAQQELLNSVYTLDNKLLRNAQANALINAIRSDPAVINSMGNVEQLVNVLEGNDEVAQLNDILLQEFPDETAAIAENIELLAIGSDGGSQPTGIIMRIIALIYLIIITIVQLIDLLKWIIDNFFGDDDGGDGGTPA